MRLVWPPLLRPSLQLHHPRRILAEQAPLADIASHRPHILVALRDHIEANYETEGDLRRTVAADIRRKIEIGCYQGRRHRMGLPGHWSGSAEALIR